MSVGAQLRQARSERQLSLAEVTRETKIQPWVLEALEADRLHEVMSPVYVKGFLTTYAKCLHLQPEPLIAQLLPPTPPPADPTPALPPAAEPFAVLMRLRLPLEVRRRLMAAVVTGAAVVGLVVVNPLRWLSHVTLPTLTLPKLASVAQVQEPVKPPPLKTVALLPAQSLELVVSAERTTWIQLRADGKLLTQQRLKRGANERWTAKKRFELIIANPSQVELTLNGQPISSFAIAHAGRLLITHQGVTRLPDDE